MHRFTWAEYADMHYMYGLADGNATLAHRLYGERFPHRTQPCHTTFSNVHNRLQVTGKLTPNGSNERVRPARTVDLEEAILEQVEDNPSTSVRLVANNIGTSKNTVWRVLNENLLHPYKLQKVQCLEPRDYPRRVNCARWFLHKEVISPNFLQQILFTDEAHFTREGVFNTRNKHLWADENPYGIVQRRFQKRFSVNVWAGIIGDSLIGPYILPNKLNGPTYLVFLREILPELLDNVPLEVRQSMWFQHDGAPPHFSVLVRDHLNATYRNNWIGRGGPVQWPPRSPDLTPIDFFLWGHMKEIVYETPVTDELDLVARIVEAAARINESINFGLVRENALRRFRLCNEVEGRHFEQKLKQFN